MGTKTVARGGAGSLRLNIKNKLRRQATYLREKKARESAKREERFRRKKEEAKDERLREERRKRNVPMTIERKRKWDDDDLGEDEPGLGKAVDLERWKRSRIQRDAQDGGPGGDAAAAQDEADEEGQEQDRDSMLDSESEDDEGPAASSAEQKSGKAASQQQQQQQQQAPSEESAADAPKTATIDLAPAALVAKFPTLFAPSPAAPKTLVTTFLHATIHKDAWTLSTLFPNSIYVPRSAHRFAHDFSVREIARFAAGRGFTALALLKEDQKRPAALSVVHLPRGPTFHFSVTSWLPASKLPGHARHDEHYDPELILNGFRTPLGVLTAHLFRSLFPPQPQLQGRQVVTLHNQRDYIFVRRHRYVFRDKRPTEKSVTGADGKELKGVEDIRAGLQEIGPRFTLKLRRIDKGIGRAGSDGQVEWEWKGGMDKKRTTFQL
jgi:ribosome production factor 1